MGSSVVCGAQALGEKVDVPGTDFYLSYRSDRNRGSRYAYTAKIPLQSEGFYTNGGVLHLVSMELKLEIAGNEKIVGYDELEELLQEEEPYIFEWDGLDDAGRSI